MEGWGGLARWWKDGRSKPSRTDRDKQTGRNRTGVD